MFLFLLVTGCGGGREVSVRQLDVQMTRASKPDKLNALLFNSSMMQNVDPNADYVIGSEDLLDIDVFQAEELRRTVRVSSQGYIGLPLIGQVKAKGLTPVQLEAELVQKLDRYMEEPLVSVYVKEYKAQKIGVVGAVTNPQVYAVTGQRYLLEMLALAGGITKDAGNVCYILRPLNAEREGISKTETIVVDLTELLEKGNIALNVPVFSGDVVHVPKGGVFFVDGAVNKPGSFQIQGRTTLVQAIAVAEGLRFEADRAEIKILRDNGEGDRTVLTADYDAIRDGVSRDIPLRENDIIVVPKQGMKNFLSGFLSAVKGIVTFGAPLY
jgi:polysaccharide export outer membrane protein